MNLKEIAYSHYMPEKRARRRANTCEGYESALRLHVVPRFGDCCMCTSRRRKEARERCSFRTSRWTGSKRYGGTGESPRDES